MMLSAAPKKWYSWDFTLREADGRHLGDLALSSWRERGRVSVAGADFTVRRDGCLGPFLLSQDGSVRGQARKSFRKRFEIEMDGDHYTLQARSAWSRTCVLRQGGEELGTISPVTWYGRKARVDLRDDLPPLLKSFVVWLTLLLWKRDADAASAGT
jgi:hypothetical protein